MADTSLVEQLLRLRPEEVDNLTKYFVRKYHLENYEDLFIKAGKILRDPEASMSVPHLTDEEKNALKHETSSGFWRQPKQLQVTIITLCVAAVVQGCTSLELPCFTRAVVDILTREPNRNERGQPELAAATGIVESTGLRSYRH